MFTVWKIPSEILMSSKDFQKTVASIKSFGYQFSDYWKEDQSKSEAVQAKWDQITAQPIADRIGITEAGFCPGYFNECANGDGNALRRLCAANRLKKFDSLEKATAFARKEAERIGLNGYWTGSGKTQTLTHLDGRTEKFVNGKRAA